PGAAGSGFSGSHRAMNAHPLTVGKTYCLRLADGRALGHVRIQTVEDSWAEGPFTPASAFAEFRELFERADQRARDQIIPLWEQAADAIDALHIQVVEEHGGAPHTGLRVFLADHEASLGTPSAWHEPRSRPSRLTAFGKN